MPRMRMRFSKVIGAIFPLMFSGCLAFGYPDFTTSYHQGKVIVAEFSDIHIDATPPERVVEESSKIPLKFKVYSTYFTATILNPRLLLVWTNEHGTYFVDMRTGKTLSHLNGKHFLETTDREQGEVFLLSPDTGAVYSYNIRSQTGPTKLFDVDLKNGLYDIINSIPFFCVLHGDPVLVYQKKDSTVVNMLDLKTNKVNRIIDLGSQLSIVGSSGGFLYVANFMKHQLLKVNLFDLSVKVVCNVPGKILGCGKIGNKSLEILTDIGRKSFEGSVIGNVFIWSHSKLFALNGYDDVAAIFYIVE